MRYSCQPCQSLLIVSRSSQLTRLPRRLSHKVHLRRQETSLEHQVLSRVYGRHRLIRFWLTCIFCRSHSTRSSPALCCSICKVWQSSSVHSLSSQSASSRTLALLFSPHHRQDRPQNLKFWPKSTRSQCQDL